MNSIMSAVKSFVDDEDGVTAIEYGLIAALMAACLATAVGYVTGALDTSFSTIKTKLTGAS